MKNSVLEFIVQYSDTDAYKVAWHGSYLRWMEAGRLDILYKNNIDIKELDEKENIIMPVVDIQIRYSKSAKLLDKIFVYTDIIHFDDVFVTFEQIIKDSAGNILTRATVRGLTLKNGKIIKGMRKIFEKE